MLIFRLEFLVEFCRLGDENVDFSTRVPNRILSTRR